MVRSCTESPRAATVHTLNVQGDEREASRLGMKGQDGWRRLLDPNLSPCPRPDPSPGRLRSIRSGGVSWLSDRPAGPADLDQKTAAPTPGHRSTLVEQRN